MCVLTIFTGGGEFKYLRGFDPYVVSSVHWFRSPRLQAAVGDFLAEERTHNQVQTMMMMLLLILMMMLLLLIKHTDLFFSLYVSLLCWQALAEYLIQNSAVSKKT